MVTAKNRNDGHTVLIDDDTGDALVIIPPGVDLHPDVEIEVEHALKRRGHPPTKAAAIRADLRRAFNARPPR